MTRLVVVAPPDFPSVRILSDAGVPFSINGDVTDADAVLLAPRSVFMLRELLPYAKRLRWIHTLAAGVETLPFDALRARNLVVTNSRGLYADALGEFVIAAMFWFAKDLRRLMRNQDGHRWEPFDVGWLQGKTVGIIGYGGIGSAIGRRAAAMGMQVSAVRRTEGDVDDVIARSDYVVLSTPLTPATRGLMSAARIAAMKPDAVLVNVSRGGVVDEVALVDALRGGRIRGAALDVFATEPLPANHALWSLDNVLISPHSADHTADAHERATRFFLENLRRFKRGEPLENVVDLREGY